LIESQVLWEQLTVLAKDGDETKLADKMIRDGSWSRLVARNHRSIARALANMQVKGQVEKLEDGRYRLIYTIDLDQTRALARFERSAASLVELLYDFEKVYPTPFMSTSFAEKTARQKELDHTVQFDKYWGSRGIVLIQLFELARDFATAVSFALAMISHSTDPRMDPRRKGSAVLTAKWREWWLGQYEIMKLNLSDTFRGAELERKLREWEDDHYSVESQATLLQEVARAARILESAYSRREDVYEQRAKRMGLSGKGRKTESLPDTSELLGVKLRLPSSQPERGLVHVKMDARTTWRAASRVPKSMEAERDAAVERIRQRLNVEKRLDDTRRTPSSARHGTRKRRRSAQPMTKTFEVHGNSVRVYWAASNRTAV
jgi:hypothetical protein